MGHAIAAALRLQQRQGLDIEATVIEYLGTRELLLVMDNCEHLLDAAAGLVDQIVTQCPRVTVLATSREALGVDGERILAVPPLAVEDAAALFADRAKAGRPDFDLDREPVGAVAEICRQLDGLPLAIELAAARIRVMSSLDLARRLDGLRLLRGGARARCRGSRASPRRSTGPTNCSPSPSRRCSCGCRSSRVGSISTRHTASAARTGRRRTTLSIYSPAWSTSPWSRSAAALTGRATSSWRHCAHTAGNACGNWGLTIVSQYGMRPTSPNWRNAPRRACILPTSGPGSSGYCPTTTTCARRSNTPWPPVTSTRRFGW